MPTSVRWAPEIERRIDNLAADTGRPRTVHLSDIIESGLEQMEDHTMAAAVLERIRQGREAVYSSAAARIDIGLDR